MIINGAIIKIDTSEKTWLKALRPNRKDFDRNRLILRVSFLNRLFAGDEP